MDQAGRQAAHLAPALGPRQLETVCGQCANEPVRHVQPGLLHMAPFIFISAARFPQSCSNFVAFSPTTKARRENWGLIRASFRLNRAQLAACGWNSNCAYSLPALSDYKRLNEVAQREKIIIIRRAQSAPDAVRAPTRPPRRAPRAPLVQQQQLAQRPTLLILSSAANSGPRRPEARHRQARRMRQTNQLALVNWRPPATDWRGRSNGEHVSGKEGPAANTWPCLDGLRED